MEEELKEKIQSAAQPPKAAERPRKKKYTKPEVVYHAPLEAMAATCTTFPGKAQGTCGTAFS